MRDPMRIDRILGMLRSVWHAHPDLRLGQLVSNLCQPTGVGNDVNPFHVEDTTMEDTLRATLAEMRKHQADE